MASSASATGTRVVVGSYSSTNWIPFWGPEKPAIRFQTLIDQDQVKYAGDITEVEYYAYYGYGGTFNNFELYLCHTDRSSLYGYFDTNYKGTPVLVASDSAFKIPARIGWFPLNMTKTFAYNNADNLLVEIRWEGCQANGEPIVVCYFGEGDHRIYAWSPKAEVGNGSPLAYFCRLSFGIYHGVAATSLGGVKALFR